MPEKELLLLMGDWNARVGSCQTSDQWNGALGRHGTGDLNEAGMFLLSFCSSNDLTIMNTCFEKKAIHKQTWQHPGTKKWHCIDYIIMRKSQRRLCSDAQVMRGAECWSDHRMLRAKLLLGKKSYTKSPLPKSPAKRLNVDDLKSDDTRDEFNRKMLEMLDQDWVKNGSTSQKLSVLVESTIAAAEQCLSSEVKRSPDWFKESEDLIKPALEKRNTLMKVWLESGAEADRKNLAQQKGKVQRLMRQAKNQWFQQKAAEIELKLARSRSPWKSIRQLQSAKFGRKPVPPRALKQEDGSLCASESECNERWKLKGTFKKS